MTLELLLKVKISLVFVGLPPRNGETYVGVKK
jgi:hypothetical protein